MKVSKSLLSAILIGIAVQTTVVSCGKDDAPQPKEQTPKDKNGQPIEPCVACGMG